MAILKVFLSFSMLIIGCSAYLKAHEKLCPEKGLIDITDGIRTTNGFEHNGLKYPLESIQYRGGRVLGCPCFGQVCMSLCCLDSFDSCENVKLNSSLKLPPIYNSVTNMPSYDVEEYSKFHFVSWDICPGQEIFAYEPTKLPKDELYIYDNGTLFLPQVAIDNQKLSYSDYCLKIINNEPYYSVVSCFLPGK